MVCSMFTTSLEREPGRLKKRPTSPPLKPDWKGEGQKVRRLEGGVSSAEAQAWSDGSSGEPEPSFHPGRLTGPHRWLFLCSRRRLHS